MSGTPDLSRLTEASRSLFAAFPVRKSKQQKAAFRAELVARLEAAGWPVQVEESGTLIKSHNVVAGDAQSARVLFTAHYDTPARLPLPNFIAPRNQLVSLLYQVLLALALCAVVFVVTFAAAYFTENVLAGTVAGFAALLGVLLLVMAGPANPRNYNDNTSGTLTLVEIAAALPEELRGAAALVFFDNEELGLVGSAQYRARLPKAGEKLVVNFDCVGDGDVMLMLVPRRCRKDGTPERLAAAFEAPAGRALKLDTSPFTLYPSDQMMFKRGVGVAALHRVPLVGLCVGRIHTGRDTVLQQENLLWLAAGAGRLAEALNENTEAP